jgi:signal peptidase I
MTDQSPTMTETAQTPPPSLKGELLEIIKTLAIALAIAVLFRIVFFQPFTIPSSSMEPGLVTGDYIIVSKFPYGWSRASLPFSPPLFKGRVFGTGPKRGDVVVFHDSVDPAKTLIKRAIGLPGDRVQVIGGAVSINGVPLQRTLVGPASDRDSPGLTPLRYDETRPDGKPYATFDRGTGHPGDDTPVYVVPEGHYFMMGDNRDNSLDSRWAAGYGVGYVAAEDIVGRADLILASWKPGASLFKPWTWLALHWDRFLKPIT